MSSLKKIFGNNQNRKKEVITMTNTEKALALINTFATGDTEKASELLAENYIQHNLAYGTGRDAFVGSVSYLASAPVKTTVNNIRAFEDRDKVFLQTVYNFAGAGEQVAFDIFRFDENGKIAEHWDNLANKAEPNPSGHTQIDGTTEINNLDKTEANKYFTLLLILLLINKNLLKMLLFLLTTSKIYYKIYKNIRKEEEYDLA